MTTQQKKPVQAVLDIFAKLYPDASTELTYENPFQLLAAVMLSAQCTDARVNQTTPALFAAYPDPKSMAAAPIPKLEKLIKSCGFYRMKAKALKSMAESVVSQHGGQIPGTMEGLVSLRGVGRKTASVILNQAFDLPAIAVDTHVARVSHRLGWTKNTDAVKIESDLKALIPEKDWSAIN
ncbi:endonuclease III, partial [bacterium]|nr:endonuclease III [bacterium]